VAFRGARVKTPYGASRGFHWSTPDTKGVSVPVDTLGSTPAPQRHHTSTTPEASTSPSQHGMPFIYTAVTRVNATMLKLV